MQGLVWDGRRLAHVDGLRVRAPGRGEVHIDVAAAGLCHSDLKPIDADIPQPVPVVLGHEACGTVTACGDDVPLAVGRRVVLSVVRACGRCRACRLGRPTRCRGAAAPQEPPFRLNGRPVHQFVRLGAFAERTVVSAVQAVPIPAGIPDAVAALLGCAAVTAFGAVEERARVEPGDTVLVIGAGGVGLNVVHAARLAGAEQVVVADRNPRKAGIAERMGATRFETVGGAAELAARARDLLPGGFDAVFECVGSAALVQTAVACLGPGGRAVIVGLPPTGTLMELPVRSLFHDQALLGCRMGGVDPHRMIPRLARRYLDGELALDPLVTALVPLSEGAGLVARLRAGDLDRGVFTVAGEGAGHAG